MKKIYINTVCIICLLIIFNSSYSQNVELTKHNFPNFKKELSIALDHIKAGDKYVEKGPGMYRLAIQEYSKANEFNADNALLNYKLGKCYLKDNDKTKAIKFLEKAYKLDPRTSIDMKYNNINYLLARAYHMDYQFDKAITKYKEHKNSLSPEHLIKEQEQIEKNIMECQSAKLKTENPTRVFIDNMGKLINSAYSDYRPLVVPDENMILFTSSRENTLGEKRDEDSYYYEDIYASYYENGRWSAPENDFEINSHNHDATAGISSDGTILYIYKSSGGNILVESTLSGDVYTFPNKLAKSINSGSMQSSAALTFDKTTLYFTSERDGGYGGQDIYYSIKDAKDRWQDPVNMGAVLNTPYDEEGVFITADGKTLYFSSRGHDNMGGYDIFKSELKDGKWIEPVNLGHPINTPDDDVFFTLAANGERAYYSSKKKDGYGGQDLYMITFLDAAKPMATTSEEIQLGYTNTISDFSPGTKIEQNTVLEGVILDAINLEPLQATIEIVDNSKNELIASFESNNSTGSYLISLKPGINYGISINKEGYMFESENFDIKEDAEATKIRKDFSLKKVEVGTKIVLHNIFFDFNKASLRLESEAELDRLTGLLMEVPTLVIEISGHTDNVGSTDYNQKLSENRAKEVVDYLLKKGINKDRLHFKGYGFTEPIASNDTEEGRQQNRRTEFKILKK